MKVFDIYFNQCQEKIYMLMEYAGEGHDLCNYIKKSGEIEEVTHEVIITEDIIKNIME